MERERKAGIDPQPRPRAHFPFFWPWLPARARLSHRPQPAARPLRL